MSSALPTHLSITLVTSKIAEVRAFYEQFFSAKTRFDCGYYVVLVISSTQNIEICLMNPQNGSKEFSGGIFLNIKFENIDAFFEQIDKTGLTICMPLEDHPWGDRGFAVLDPAGAIVYCYNDIPPSEEYKQYHV